MQTFGYSPDVEGLFTADPRLSSQASLVEEVKDRSGDRRNGRGEGNYFSTGG